LVVASVDGPLEPPLQAGRSTDGEPACLRSTGGKHHFPSIRASAQTWLTRQRGQNAGGPPPEVIADIAHEAASVPASGAQLKHTFDQSKGVRADEQQEAEQALRHSSGSGLSTSVSDNEDQWDEFITIIVTVLGIIFTIALNNTLNHLRRSSSRP
jgi:hypothetical protein